MTEVLSWFDAAEIEPPEELLSWVDIYKESIDWVDSDYGGIYLMMKSANAVFNAACALDLEYHVMDGCHEAIYERYGVFVAFSYVEEEG